MSEANEVIAIAEKIISGVFTTENILGKSAIWSCLQKIRNDQNEIVPFLHCKKCAKILKYPTNSTTSNFLKHKCVKLMQQENTNSTSKKFKSIDESWKNECAKKMVNFCAADLRSFNVVNGNGFKALAKFLLETGEKFGSNINLEEFLPHATTISRKTFITAEEERMKLLHILIPLIRDGKLKVLNIFLFFLTM